MEVVRSVSIHGRRPTTSLRVLMAAGGTGGHILPALAVAEELRTRAQERRPADPDCAIQFLGAGRPLEALLIEGGGFPLHTIAAAGLKGIGGWRKVRNLLLLPRSAFETASILRAFQPNVVVGTGGYTAGPAVLEAALQDIPTMLIEPNALPGFTNRVLAPVVRLAAVAFEETARAYGAKARLTGAPIRRAFAQIQPKPHVPPFTILVLGGSQGSKVINGCVIKSLPLLLARLELLSMIHQAGERDYNVVEEAYREKGISAEVYAFIEDLPKVLARADLVIARAGAMTVAELAAAGKASVLVPFAVSADRHQLENARTLERAGAARVIEEAELAPERLVEELCDLLGSPKRLMQMEQQARLLAHPDAAERIADLIEELASR